ncbi:MAG: hypothetical protein JSV64_07245 [Candidatus Bathyarchaeota archaeon]|nr:MAG: hypothetical protein JSV64_07245 [Candidatus Bathyarchaeota archaeon]
MTRAIIVKKELSERAVHFLGIYIETKNAVLAFLSESEDQLGTLAASVPQATQMQMKPLVSSILLGDRNTATARILAERLAAKTGKIGLVSVHLSTMNETEANPILIKLFNKLTTTDDAPQTASAKGDLSI